VEKTLKDREESGGGESNVQLICHTSIGLVLAYLDQRRTRMSNFGTCESNIQDTR
jgi:hypothetical protein